MPATILVVEDEKKLNAMICDYLDSVGFETRTAYDGLVALDSINSLPPDLIILDIMLPGMDGMDVTRRVRANHEIPIIMLTARAEEGDKLLGLELGADDYITKPFSVKELAARVRAVLRRTSTTEEKPAEEILRHLDLELDLERRTVRAGGRNIVLTSAQFDLLRLFVERPGRVFSRSEILEAVFSTDVQGYERTVDVHIKNIRKALEPDPSKPRYIQTVWGVGYRMSEDPE